MAGGVSKEGLRTILIQAMSAAKSVRFQRDRLLQRSPGGDDGDAAVVQEVAAGLFKVYYRGLEFASRYLTSCIQIALESGACLLRDLEPAFAVIPNEQLYGVLLAQRLPARPATLAEAFARVEAVLYAVKLPEEHHVPRCIQLLVGVRPPTVTGEPLPFIGMTGYPDDPVAAAHEHVAKNGFPNPAQAAAAIGKGPQAPACSVDLDQALTYLHCACSITILAIKHIDLAIAVFSSFFDPKELADTAELADKIAFIPDYEEAEEESYSSD